MAKEARLFLERAVDSKASSVPTDMEGYRKGTS